MSGPKSSRYYLTQRQREIIQEQLRKERERKILEEKKKKELSVLKNKKRQMKDLIVELVELVDSIEQSYDASEKDKLQMQAIRKKCSASLSVLEYVDSLSVDSELGTLQTSCKKVSEIIKELLSEKRKVIQIQEICENDVRDRTIDFVVPGFDLTFSNIGNRKALHTNKYTHLIYEALESVRLLDLPDVFSEKFQDIKAKSEKITSVDYLENFYSITVLSFVKECRKYHELLSKYGEQYLTLKIRYDDLCRELGKEPEDIELTEQAVSILLEKITELEAEEMERREQEYIQKCIDEAMEEMNYSVVGGRTVIKKNGRQFKNILYKFAEGTAVNVTISKDGQISMELGAVDSVDRVPSVSEQESLVKHMVDFCEDYSEIEKRLKAKGVEVQHISHLPPQAQYAQVINIADYDMYEDIGMYDERIHKKQASQIKGVYLQND